MRAASGIQVEYGYLGPFFSKCEICCYNVLHEYEFLALMNFYFYQNIAFFIQLRFSKAHIPNLN